MKPAPEQPPKPKLLQRFARLPQPTLLLLWLACLSAYRIWVIPRLGITLYVDEAQYWTWTLTPDWGYFSKPPVIAWLIGATTAILGDGLIGVKMPSLLLYPATSWLLYLVGTRLFDQRVGFRVAIAFSLMPLVSALGLFVSTDAPLLFCWTAAMLALLRVVEKDRLKDWMVFGAVLGIGIMAKYTMAAMAVSVLLFLAIEPGRRKLLTGPNPWIAALLALLFVAPNILWNWTHDFPTLHHVADITHVADGGETIAESSKASNLGEFVLAQAASLGPGFSLAFLAALVWSIRNWRSKPQQFLLAHTLPLLFLVVMQASRSEANGNWAAPALVGALLLAVAYLSRLRSVWWLLALALNALIMVGVYQLQDIRQVLDITQTAKMDPLKRARGWDKLADRVKPYFAAHPNAILLGGNRTVLAHMLYELRELHLATAAWAPNERAADHYQLTMPLEDEQTSRPYLLVAQGDSAAIAKRFMSSKVLETIRIEVEPGLVREASVVLLEGFKGYR